jgi:hypothetical protein
VKHDFRIDVNRGVEPCFFFLTELDLFLIDGDTIWFGRKVLVVVLGIGLIPVLNGSSGSADAEPLAEIAAFS